MAHYFNPSIHLKDFQRSNSPCSKQISITRENKNKNKKKNVMKPQKHAPGKNSVVQPSDFLQGVWWVTFVIYNAYGLEQ